MAIDQSCLAAAEMRARAAYSQAGRHYHDVRHLDDCLAQLGKLPNLSGQDRQLLRWAILWHDAVYEPMRSDNEERSAELASNELVGCGVDDGVATEVARLILLTKGHQVDPADIRGGLLVSIDLSILGADDWRYRAYVEDVRREYHEVPDDAWRSGRSAVLTKLLAADPLYPEPSFRRRLESFARRNMAAELKALAAN